MLAKRIQRFIDLITDVLGRVLSWLTVGKVLVMVSIVILRYAFSYGNISLQESIMYLNAIMFTFGAAYTLKQQGHVRVDVFYGRLSSRHQAMVDITGILVFLYPSMLFIIYLSWDYVALSWRVREASAETSGLPLVYLLKTCIVLMPAMLIWQGTAELLRNIHRLQSSKP
ncbi:MAG: TRAP transporter small permease subunit [Gammaproteobacteria bacterium]